MLVLVPVVEGGRNAQGYVVVEEREPWTAVLVVVAVIVALIITFWKVVLLAVVVTLAVRYVRYRHRAAAAERERLSRNADIEHRALKRGNVKLGTYGAYPPEVTTAVDRIGADRSGASLLNAVKHPGMQQQHAIEFFFIEKATPYGDSTG